MRIDPRGKGPSRADQEKIETSTPRITLGDQVNVEFLFKNTVFTRERIVLHDRPRKIRKNVIYAEFQCRNERFSVIFAQDTIILYLKG